VFRCFNSPQQTIMDTARTHDKDDADSFSSDSDDEFLTMRDAGKGRNVDREALVRKKLLESFYGTTAADHQHHDDGTNDSDEESNASRERTERKPPNRSASHDTYDDDVSDDDINRHSGSRQVDPVSSADLDSVDFDAAKHTAGFVLHSGVRPLLETEESLACQVRTLDSSMQTLVYENYSRFIEATDAIRSIGVNVQANTTNLQKLSSSMETVGKTARSVETSCGTLRDSVVEKLRVKRLLQRLDALLKLPSTLRENIDAGRYRWASKSYLTAYSILSKHSAGFESLQRIEIECYEIMEAMLVDVRRKLRHWSGNMVLDDIQHPHDDLDGSEGGSHYPNCQKSDPLALLDDPPDPPKSVAEIFECTGTTVLMLRNFPLREVEQTVVDSTGELRKEDIMDLPATISRMASRVEFDPGLTIEESKEMSLSACLRFLERYLDMHHFELQEAMFATEGTDGLAQFSESISVPSMRSSQLAPSGNASMSCFQIPTKVLDGILEAATLYSMTFCSENGRNSEQLCRFVSTAFETFLQSVRSELLEQLTLTCQKDWTQEVGVSVSGTPAEHLADGAKAAQDTQEDLVDSDEKASEQVTTATSMLVESVRQLASGLSLPEVAINLELSSGLVERAIQLSEAMVRRRVDQKFYSLRFRVIENCLLPFCRNLLRDSVETTPERQELEILPGEDRSRVTEAVQMASVALSDSLQLVDDTIRSILSNSKSGTVHGRPLAVSSDEDAYMLKTAVHQSSNRFASWLAAALETLADCGSSEPSHVVDVKPENVNSERVLQYLQNPILRDGLGDDDREFAERVENRMLDLLDEIDDIGSRSAKSCLSLAIFEMCRLAQLSVSDDLAASIATHTGSNNKQRATKVGLFATSPGGHRGENANPTSDRFRLAASRVLNLYAIDQGCEAAAVLCSILPGLSKKSIPNGTEPSPNACSLLASIKRTCTECADLFGGPKSGGPIPESLEDAYTSLTMSRQHQLRSAGLAFDVERMFAEKIVVYPPSFEYAEFSRNAVVFLVFKVTLKELLENSRNVRFSVPGYRQFLIDTEFLKFLLPHYVKDEALPDGSNRHTMLETLLSDTCTCAKERCDGSAMLQDNNWEINQARAVVRDFMLNNKDETFLNHFLISEHED
jgi:vacuolar protein sorting-associated protein 51